MNNEDFPFSKTFDIGFNEEFSEYLTVPNERIWRIDVSTLNGADIEFATKADKDKWEMFKAFMPSLFSEQGIWIPEEIKFRFQNLNNERLIIKIFEHTTEEDLEEEENRKEEVNKESEDDNYSIVVKMVTNYYMELSTSTYKKRFRNDLALFTTIGLLDAQIYVFQEKSIELEEIVEIAKGSLEKQNPLLDFIINIGILISIAEEPDFELRHIENAWDSQKEKFLSIIEGIKANYPLGTNEEEVAKQHVELFMNSLKTKQIRKSIGIKNNLFF